jgi:hypothetical protein
MNVVRRFVVGLLSVCAWLIVAATYFLGVVIGAAMFVIGQADGHTTQMVAGGGIATVALLCGMGLIAFDMYRQDQEQRSWC